MAKRMTTSQFIERAISIHGDQYDYSLVDYKTTYIKVKIICKEHGEFEQVPKDHIISKSGCPKCRTTKTKQTNLNKYGHVCYLHSTDGKHKVVTTNLNKYGYSNVLQSPIIQKQVKQTNLIKYGHENITKNPKIRQKQKLTKKIRYGNEYFTNRTKFKNTIRRLNGNERSFNLLEDVNWLTVQYIEQNKSAQQIALELGTATTTVLRYLYKYNFTIVHSYNYSHKCISWLDTIMEVDNIHIQHALNDGEYQIPGTRYKADGYCQETNTIYEFHGDYWHGNPKIYDSNDMNKVIRLSMGELYERTIKKEEEIRQLGYIVVVMWESDLS